MKDEYVCIYFYILFKNSNIIYIGNKFGQ